MGAHWAYGHDGDDVIDFWGVLEGAWGDARWIGESEIVGVRLYVRCVFVIAVVFGDSDQQ